MLLRLVTTFSILLLVSLKAIAHPSHGLQYKKHVTDKRQIIHVVRIDPHQNQIALVQANSSSFGREPVAKIAKRNKAIAAINGGFFRIGGDLNGLPAGVLKINSQWHGIAYRLRGAMAFNAAGTEVIMDRIQTTTTLKINNYRYPVHLMNQPQQGSKAILYTPGFGTLLQGERQGTDVVIANNQVKDLLLSGKTEVPKEGFVYSFTPKNEQQYPKIHVGAKAVVDIQIEPQLNKNLRKRWNQMDFVIGGAPLLIHNGKVINNFSAEKVRAEFITHPYARTAVGIDKAKHWLWVVVENNPFNNQPGMTLSELARFMHQEGAVQALNLDGGGSSTLYLDDKIINHVEGDEDESLGLNLARPVSNAFIVLDKQQS